jgi:hydroxyethylthiazole kinase-like uncharacterized protein yjeF
MHRITPDGRWPLFDTAATRRIEHALALALPPHTLMARAGLAVARLALALAPHAKTIWVACGPGNNGGDGLEAALNLRRLGKSVCVSWLGRPDSVPADARTALDRLAQAGIALADQPPAGWDLAIDALLGIGVARAPQGAMADWIAHMNSQPCPILSVDLPSGLDADRGTGIAVRASVTLSLLTLKPGLFTAQGRDAAGSVWLDDLGADIGPAGASAWLGVAPHVAARPHASHKGSFGDVAVIGGAPGMAGAALLAACAALHGGAGRVLIGLLDAGAMAVDPAQPELMLRPWDSLDLAAMSVACGCGGGQAVRAVLPQVLATSHALVLDADGLNAVAADSQLQAQLRTRAARDRATVLTPHPLEAARLLDCSVAQVQADRLAAAQQLAERFDCVAVLKGSGTVTAAPGELPVVNPTGNAKLATAGTGDVLAGMVAARLAQGMTAFDAAAQAVQAHGACADHWPPGQPLTASALARRA